MRFAFVWVTAVGLLLGVMPKASAEPAFDLLCQRVVDADLHQSIEVISKENLLLPLTDVRIAFVGEDNRPLLVDGRATSLDAEPAYAALKCIMDAIDLPVFVVENLEDANASFVRLDPGDGFLRYGEAGWPDTLRYAGSYGGRLREDEVLGTVMALDEQVAKLAPDQFIDATEDELYHAYLVNIPPSLKVGHELYAVEGVLTLADGAWVRDLPAGGTSSGCAANVVSDAVGALNFTRVVDSVARSQPLFFYRGDEQLDASQEAVFLRNAACWIMAFFETVDPRLVAFALDQEGVDIITWGQRHWPFTTATGDDGTVDYDVLCQSIDQPPFYPDPHLFDRDNLVVPLERLRWSFFNAQGEPLGDEASLAVGRPAFIPIGEAISCVLQRLGIESEFVKPEEEYNAIVSYGRVEYYSDVLVINLAYERFPLGHFEEERFELPDRDLVFMYNIGGVYYHFGHNINVRYTSMRLSGLDGNCRGTLYSNLDDEGLLDIQFNYPWVAGDHAEVIFRQFSTCLMAALLVELDAAALEKSMIYATPVGSQQFRFNLSRRNVEDVWLAEQLSHEGSRRRLEDGLMPIDP